MPNQKISANLKSAIADELNKDRFDVSESGIIFPTLSVGIEGTYFTRVNGGEWDIQKNLITKEGLIDVLNTYFEKSTRGALKSALEQMWQAELYMRLFEPEKSLPFQYKALELLKTVQQKSRVYIKRTGYDPPPIKADEIRLSGKLEQLGTRLEKELAELEEQIEPLASEVLGLLLQQELSAAEKGKVKQLGQLWSTRIQNSGMEDWSVLLALQELEAGKLNEKGKNRLREKLYPFAKNYKTTDPSRLSNKALRNAFLKKNP